MFSCKWQPKGGQLTDISNYVTRYNWNGDLNQAARRLDFTIAYTTKDSSFKNLSIAQGDMIHFYYAPDNQQKLTWTEIFRGVVVFAQRNSNSFTFEYNAYDLSYYLRSKMTRKFNNILADDLIRQVCQSLGIKVGFITPLGVTVKFIADGESASQIIKKALKFVTAKTGKKYYFYMSQDSLNVVPIGTLVDNPLISNYNVEDVKHSVSLQNMVNQVQIVNEHGETVSYLKNDSDITNYGLLQDVYKQDKNQDTQSFAKLKLKTVEFTSTVNALGDIQYITGFSVVLKEEQLQGQFLIKSDRHSIENNVHKMELVLEYLDTYSMMEDDS